MPFPQKLAFLLVLACAPAWTQTVSVPAQAEDPSKSAIKPTQAESGSVEKSPPDQASPAASPPDSKKLVAVKTQKAIYPEGARERKIQGEVVLKILVSETGDVESAEVESGDAMLGRPAIDAVKKWKFNPFIKNGRAVKVSTKVPIDFAFSDKIMDNGVSADGSTTVESKTPQTSAPLPSPPPEPLFLMGPRSKRVRVAGGVSQGLLVHQVAPVYPDAARQSRIEGTVVLQAIISKEGRIADLKVISGPKELARAALGAVQQWQYRPYLLMGEPVEVLTTVQVNFQLR
jgi:TonB family protein